MLKEQAVQNEDGTLRLRRKEDGGMDGSILLNPVDPDAIYRQKSGNGAYSGKVNEELAAEKTYSF